MAKGSGMIHPNMATTLGVVCTDAVVAPSALQRLLHAACDTSFNAISVDGDLRDWAEHASERCYSNVAFATASGDEVVFESYGDSKWFGPDDFSVKFMLSWVN